RGPVRALGRLGQALLPEPAAGVLHVAAVLFEGPLGVHHPGARPLAQRLHVLGAEVGGRVTHGWALPSGAVGAGAASGAGGGGSGAAGCPPSPPSSPPWRRRWAAIRASRSWACTAAARRASCWCWARRASASASSGVGSRSALVVAGRALRLLAM